MASSGVAVSVVDWCNINQTGGDQWPWPIYNLPSTLRLTGNPLLLLCLTRLSLVSGDYDSVKARAYAECRLPSVGLHKVKGGVVSKHREPIFMSGFRDFGYRSSSSNLHSFPFNFGFFGKPVRPLNLFFQNI